MKVAFRADASLQIGTGHVMRWLTLADALSARGADCRFICRAHEGHLIEFIRGKGYVAHALPILPSAGSNLTAHGSDALISPTHEQGSSVRPEPVDGHCRNWVSTGPTPSLANGSSTDRDLAHSHWIGATQAQDTAACAPILAAQRPDWLIVDHYALDARWGFGLAQHYRCPLPADCRITVVMGAAASWLGESARRRRTCPALTDPGAGRHQRHGATDG